MRAFGISGNLLDRGSRGKVVFLDWSALVQFNGFRVGVNVLQNKDSEHKVVIHGYEEHFAYSPEVKVFCDGKEICKVGHHEQKEINLTGDKLLKFKCSFRTTKAMVCIDEHNHVLLSLNRFTGALNAHLANDTNLENVKKIKVAKARNNLIKSGLFIGALALLWFKIS
jgi:hypothetical protein